MLERRSASQNKTEHLQTFKLARPKGLLHFKLIKYKPVQPSKKRSLNSFGEFLACPTHWPSVSPSLIE